MARQTLSIGASLVTAGLAVVGGWSARAEDYRPVTCDAHAAYQGRALHAPVDPALTGVIPDAPLSPSTVATLDQTFAKMRDAAHAPGLGIAVGRVGEGVWSRTEKPPGAQRLWWASAGKMFVAVVVLQLAEEKKLSLEDPASRWVKGLPNGEVITVRDLLAHTSGLFSANEDLKVHAKPHYLAPAETLAILRRHGAMSCPGAVWRYSNSGYDVLAQIVEAVDGRSLGQAIEARIVTPLGLSSVKALTPGALSPEVAPPTTAKGDAAMAPGMAGAGGPIAADPADMVRFLGALLDGKLLPPTAVRAMFDQLYPMFDAGTWYGLGAMAMEVNDAGRDDLWLGHAGGAPGVSAMLA